MRNCFPFGTKRKSMSLLAKWNHCDSLLPKVIEEVFQEILEEEGDIIFNEEFYRLPDKERTTLRAMAKTEGGKLSEISRNIEDGVNVVSKYLEYLIVKGIVEKENRGIYKIADPVFGDWIKRNFR